MPGSAPDHMPPLLEVSEIGKRYGHIEALRGISATVDAGEVLCVLGDNGAGKSSLIKIVAGEHPHTSGSLLLDGEPVTFTGPRDAIAAGIATVYQDLAMVPMMPVWRNFFLGSERTVGRGPLRRLDVTGMKRIANEQLASMGIHLRDLDQPVGTLSGGERQSVAIARAVYVGARVLILDEPTAALGVTQAARVLQRIAAARDRGLAVIFITHNPQHAYPVGTRFLVLSRGESLGLFTRENVTLPELTTLMSGGELEAL
ncbi:ATP-binding cassette domain-containing protein [Lysinibacter cavernae]